jgi:hypothetical protein
MTMLADKTLLSVTLAATFVAGTLTGYTARSLRPEPPFQPGRAEHVYARQLAELRGNGWTDDEIAAARTLYQEYLDDYGTWWTQFLETHQRNLDAVDSRFEKGFAELDGKVRLRLSGEAR